MFKKLFLITILLPVFNGFAAPKTQVTCPSGTYSSQQACIAANPQVETCNQVPSTNCWQAPEANVGVMQ